MILGNDWQPLQKMKKYIHFLIYVTNEEQQKEKEGGGQRVRRVRGAQAGPVFPPWLALRAHAVQKHASAQKAHGPAPVGKSYVMIQWRQNPVLLLQLPGTHRV